MCHGLGVNCNRENKEYVEGLNSKVKLGLYKVFSEETEFKRHLHGVIVMLELDAV